MPLHEKEFNQTQIKFASKKITYQAFKDDQKTKKSQAFTQKGKSNKFGSPSLECSSKQSHVK